MRAGPPDGDTVQKWSPRATPAQTAKEPDEQTESSSHPCCAGPTPRATRSREVEACHQACPARSLPARAAPPPAPLTPGEARKAARAAISERFGLDPTTLDGALLHAVEIEEITGEITAHPGGNLLVFGCGNDSLFWERVNSGGETVFLEHHPGWAAEIGARITSRVVLVEYDTLRPQWEELLRQPDRLAMELPADIRERRRDVIFVDGPTGFDDDTPGRMKSIFEASRLVAPGGMVFVHDCERTVEAAYSAEYLGDERLRVSVNGHALLRGYRF